MPTPSAVLPDLPDISAVEIAGCLKQWLEDDERSPFWLAKKIGVGDPRTLKSWIEDRPDLLPVDAWLSALAVLGRTWQDVRTTVAALRSPEIPTADASQSPPVGSKAVA